MFKQVGKTSTFFLFIARTHIVENIYSGQSSCVVFVDKYFEPVVKGKMVVVNH